jgi:hypothetical protein
MRRPQITTIALPKVRGSPRRGRYGEALAALSSMRPIGARHVVQVAVAQPDWICPNEPIGNLSESPFDCSGVGELRVAHTSMG